MSTSGLVPDPVRQMRYGGSGPAILVAAFRKERGGGGRGSGDKE